jgi:3-hydroxyisobutyrate dehydrogenase
MGRPMATNLASAGFTVHAFDTNKDTLARLSDPNIVTSDSIAHCMQEPSIVYMMLPNGSIVMDVLSKIMESAKGKVTIIDCSTIDIEDALKAHKLAEKHGHEFLDAPVSGGVGGATAGTLTAMIGGQQSVLETLSPYLEPVFKTTIYCGAAGAGQAAKICNNMLLATTMIGVSESFNLADKLGLSADTLFKVLSTSTGSCWSVNSYCPVAGTGPDSPADRDYAPGFTGAMMLKDMKLTQNAAKAAQVATPLGAQSLDLYDRYVAEGYGAKDFSGIIRFLKSIKDV